MNSSHTKLSAAGLLIALGIIYGDIGTSPLYVFNAIINNRMITESLIVGSLSCIIWTLTLQTTIKYVILVLRADNKGEGGTFSLYALVHRRRKWLVIPAMIGGAALLSDGIITPPISITSAIEGLVKVPGFGNFEHYIVYIVLTILAFFFLMQQFGTGSIGRLFGPVMLIWFSLLGILGALHVMDDLAIFRAFNPFEGLRFLRDYPQAIWILGAVFLCTTGAEALYSDLGHCGKQNIRISWIFVKSTLILNYLGQGASLLKNHEGATMTSQFMSSANIHAFYDLMPEWFVLFGVLIATTAAIIASQAMISGSFTLISEGMRLNLWPKFKIRYPSEAKGQLFIPKLNLMMFIGCVLVVLIFRTSSEMEGTYGLAIVLTMITTTILFANYLVLKRIKPFWIYSFLFVFLIIEGTYLISLMQKFPRGGYFTMIVAALMFCIMYIWYRSRKIKNRYVEFVRLEQYIPQLQELSDDQSIAKYATHLVYLTSANNHKEIEHKILYSILNRKPKRADIYWFIHVDTLDDPYTCEYSVETIVPNKVIRVEFRLGFRMEPRIHIMFKQVVADLVAKQEVNITSRYTSLEKNNIPGDFQFIVMEKFLSQDNELPFTERIVMKLFFWLKHFSLSEEKAFGLETSSVVIEKFPLVVMPVSHLNMKRIFPEH